MPVRRIQRRSRRSPFSEDPIPDDIVRRYLDESYEDPRQQRELSGAIIEANGIGEASEESEESGDSEDSGELVILHDESNHTHEVESTETLDSETIGSRDTIDLVSDTSSGSVYEPSDTDIEDEDSSFDYSSAPSYTSDDLLLMPISSSPTVSEIRFVQGLPAEPILPELPPLIGSYEVPPPEDSDRLEDFRRMLRSRLNSHLNYIRDNQISRPQDDVALAELHTETSRLYYDYMEAKADLGRARMLLKDEILQREALKAASNTADEDECSKCKRPFNLGATTSRVSDCATSGEQEKCIICTDKPVDTVIVHCGHLVACFECASMLDDCPVCRKSKRQAVKVFRR